MSSPISSAGTCTAISHLTTLSQTRRTSMCEREACERSDLWQHRPNHTTLSKQTTGQAPGSFSFTHTLLQSAVVQIMDIRSELNFYYFQTSTSKCEKCHF